MHRNGVFGPIAGASFSRTIRILRMAWHGGGRTERAQRLNQQRDGSRGPKEKKGLLHSSSLFISPRLFSWFLPTPSSRCPCFLLAMSSTNAAINPETTHSGRDSLSPSAGRTGASPSPWRSTSLAARSPSPSYSNSFRDSDSTGSSHRSHSGANSSEQRQRPHPVASSGGWSSRRGNERSQGDLHSNTLSSSAFGSFSRSTNTLSSSPSVGAGAAAATSPGAGAGGLGAGAGASANVQKQPLNMEDLAAKFADSKEAKEKFAALQLSPALAPADKERRTPMGSFVPPSSHFAHIKVQRTASLNQNAHSPLLTRGMYHSSSVCCSISHHALLHTVASLTGVLLSCPTGAGGRLQPGHVAQSTEMRRTASHNNAFSSGLGTSLGSSSGALDHSSSGHLNGSSSTSTSPTTANGSHSTILGGGGGGHGSSAQLAPFSLSQLAPRAPRRSSPQPPEYRLPSPQDQVLQAPTSTPSPLTADKHPLQHTWQVSATCDFFFFLFFIVEGPTRPITVATNGLRPHHSANRTLYYDVNTGYNNRHGSSNQNYENNLKELGTFSTASVWMGSIDTWFTFCFPPPLSPHDSLLFIPALGRVHLGRTVCSLLQLDREAPQDGT